MINLLIFNVNIVSYVKWVSILKTLEYEHGARLWTSENSFY